MLKTKSIQRLVLKSLPGWHPYKTSMIYRISYPYSYFSQIICWQRSSNTIRTSSAVSALCQSLGTFNLTLGTQMRWITLDDIQRVDYIARVLDLIDPAATNPFDNESIARYLWALPDTFHVSVPVYRGIVSTALHDDREATRQWKRALACYQRMPGTGWPVAEAKRVAAWLALTGSERRQCLLDATRSEAAQLNLFWPEAAQ